MVYCTLPESMDLHHMYISPPTYPSLGNGSNTRHRSFIDPDQHSPRTRIFPSLWCQLQSFQVINDGDTLMLTSSQMACTSSLTDINLTATKHISQTTLHTRWTKNSTCHTWGPFPLLSPQCTTRLKLDARDLLPETFALNCRDLQLKRRRLARPVATGESTSTPRRACG